ncbi:MAG TPA: S1/P1 nuclease [Allosphingosinicella sp.]|jgi:hypothetical protein
MKAWKHCAAAAAALALAAPAAAWNARGHMMVAAAAWQKLTPRSRAGVSQLLRLNPAYASWTAGVPAAQRDQVAFVHAATWPDDNRGDHTYTDDGSRPSGPNAARNIGYDDCLLHRYWHFDDLAFSPDGTPVEAPADPNAATQIKAFAATLGDGAASNDVKSYDLTWLIHLVGDVHQPLHATSRFTAETPHGDAGGNLVALCAKPCRDNLHSLWDDALGKDKSPTAAIAAAAALPVPSMAQSADLDVADWLAESLALSRTAVYVAPIGPGKGPYTVTAPYKASATAIARQRVALAGARLARLINGAKIKVAATPAKPRQCVA